MNLCFFKCRRPFFLSLFIVLCNSVIYTTTLAQSAPVINNVPAEVTIDCIDDVPDPVDLEATDDDPGFPKLITPVDMPEAADITPVCALDTIFRIWTAESDSATITRDTQLIIINPDETPPTIGLDVERDTASCEIALDDNNPQGYASWKNEQNIRVNTNIDTLITDNCSGIDFGALEMEEIIDGPCGTREYRFTITDNCGQTATWSAFYTVLDTVPPVFVDLPGDTIVSCDDPYLIAPAPIVTATDNCSMNFIPVLTVDDDQEVNGSCKEFQYTITRTWTVSDDCGNETTGQQIINVNDLTAPTFTEPDDIIISCTDDANDLDLTGDVTDAVDECGGPVNLDFSDQVSQGSCPNDTIITRTWRARDVCGNTTTRTQTITKKDDTPPTFTPPRDTMVDCSIGEQVDVTGRPTGIQDNCGNGFRTPTFIDVIVDDPLCESKYTVKRTWTIEDSCGNAAFYEQIIEVMDLQAPAFSTAPMDLTIICADDLNIETAFEDWLTNRAGASATDNCELLDTIFVFNSGTDQVPDLSTFICPANGDTVLMQQVDFIIEDACGNRDTAMATFAVIDNTPPTIIECQSDTTIFTNPGECSATFALIPPAFEEECSASLEVEDIVSENTLTSAALPGEEGNVPVDPTILNFPLNTSQPVNAFTDASLTISLISADAETESEHLIIKGEDGSILGRTATTDVSCGNSDTTVVITRDQFNEWASDGVISIGLEPNIPVGQAGRFAVNDICENGTIVRGNLQVTVKSLETVRFRYRKDDEPLIDADFSDPVMATFDQGTHTVAYILEDCAGNVDSCTFILTVRDNEPPELSCPDDIVIVLPPDTCSVALTLPFIEDITDNCAARQQYLETLPNDTTDALIRFQLDPNLNDYLAMEDSVVFTNVAANAIGDVNVVLDVKGDFSTNGAFIDVFSENGLLIGSTRVGIADCNNAGQQGNLTIPAATFNEMAVDGQITLRLVPNDITVPPGVAGDGINPCDADAVTEDGDTDGVSYVFVTLEYDFINASFYTEGATEIGLTAMASPEISPTLEFGAGLTDVFYIVADQSGNPDTCSFQIAVRDEQLPEAICQPTTLFINPSGLDVQTISAAEIDAGSFDNCGIDTMFLSPNTFTCNEVGLTTNTTLTVVDLMGNESTCTVPIRIEVESPVPTANSGICGGDTLFLISNPPPAPGGVIYTYKWFNPSGILISQEENPIIPNISADNAGAYRVEVEGITGCVATGIVQVVIEDLPLRPKINTEQNICIDQPISLQSTENPNSSNVIYRWYEGLPPNGVLIQETNVPFITLPGPHPTGTRDFYLIIEADGCVSQPSIPFSVEASEPPTAIVNEDEITICAGESISLGTFVTGTDIVYQWRGPNGFTSNAQLPTVIDEATTADAGVYSLIISRNGCESEEDFTVVNVLPRPDRPMLVSNGPLCAGENAILTTDNESATTYNWIAPDLQEFTTSENEFRINNAQVSASGTWQVYVTQFGCDSERSVPLNLQVNTVPNAIASAERQTVCEGNTINLLAAPEIDGATYIWRGPNNYTTAIPNPVIQNAGSAQVGTYELTVTTIAGCSSTSTIDIDVEEGVTITAVSNDGPSCLNGPTDIELVATVFPKDDGSYTYLWTGPNGFASPDSSAVIPNATAANNGNYSLRVTNGSGCVSNIASTVVDVSDPPPTPPLPGLSMSTPAPFCIGGNVSLETDSYTGNEVTYHWNTPNGVTVTEEPSISVDQLSMEDSGQYSVFVTVDGCRSRTSRSYNLIVNENPTIQATSNSPVCSGQNLEISAQALTDATYRWNGPSDFTSSSRTFRIPQARTNEHSGTYTVVATVNGCPSVPFELEVEVMTTPQVPTIDNSGPVCISDTGSLLVLSVDTASATPEALYSWFVNGEQNGEETEELNFGIKDFTGFQAGVFNFRAQARLGMCSSVLSEPTAVVMNTIPSSQAFAGADREECAENEIFLNATAPGIGTGMWRLVAGDTSGLIIANPEMASTPVEGLKGGNDYIFRWTLSNGACRNYSSDQITLNVVNAELAEAGDDILACIADEVTLGATPPSVGQGTWSQSAVQRALGVTIADSNDPNTVVSGLEQGNRYSFEWTIEGSCGEFSDDVFVTISDPEPFAGDDLVICNDNGSAILEAIIPAETSDGQWESLNNENAFFVDESDPNTVVQGLQEGDNVFVWTIDEGICGDISRDTVVLSYTLSPKANDDQINVAFGESVTFDVLENDFLPKTVTVNILTQPDNGNLMALDESTFTYEPNINYVGEDHITYEICSEACECSVAEIVLTVGEGADCKAPNIITPNGDGINDTFVIPCLLDLNNFPNSQLLIFNEWGDEVFRSSQPYNNDWGGTFDGQDLPVGVYFYIIDYGGVREAERGFVAIQR